MSNEIEDSHTDKYDYKPDVKSRKQQEAREEDYAYIAEHPEIRTIVRSFLRQVFIQQPTDIHRFSENFGRALRKENLEDKSHSRYQYSASNSPDFSDISNEHSQ